jgi:hypothetical protein
MDIRTRLSLYERAAAYNNTWPRYAPLHVWNGCIYGYWTMGNNFAGSGYYGSFPGNLFARIQSLYPDIDPSNTLHLFSGSIEPGAYHRFDRKIVRDDEPEMDSETQRRIVLGNAEEIGEVWNGALLHLITADPPYTGEDAAKYGTVLVNRQRVFLSAMALLRHRGHLLWFDQVKPMYTGAAHALVGNIGVDISTNHRIRGVWIFEKRSLS